MNEENGKIEENPPEEKGGDTHPPVSDVRSEESYNGGPKGTEQSDNPASLQQISRWSRFKKWFLKITVAEAGMLVLTLAIAASSVVYTKYAKRQWKVMRGQLPELHTSAEAAKDAAKAETKQLEMSERPWVDAIVTPDGPFDFNGYYENRSLRSNTNGFQNWGERWPKAIATCDGQ
jgi:hypothetical protein